MNKIEVFLSYKNSDANGDKTQDARMAEELYTALLSLGINTFYSNQTIGIMGDSHYKMVIDDALDDAKVLVAIGTSLENLESNWVRYEWDSFYGDILSGRKNGEVISYIDNMSMNDLPRSLRRCQSFKRGDSSLSEICDFIIAYLNKNKENKKELDSNNCSIVKLSELFTHGVTALDAEKAFAENDKFLYPGMPSEIAGSAEQWAAIIQKYPDFSAAVVDEKYNIYGNYSLMGLTTKEEELIAKGLLKDQDLSANTADNMYRAGYHTGYLLNLSVNPSAESSELYNSLWRDLIETLVHYARDEKVFFSKIFYKAFLPEHETKVIARGFNYCCEDELYGKVYVHNMDPDSTLLAFDPELAAIYAKDKNKNQEKEPDQPVFQDIAALSAYMDFWKQIEELFYRPEYIRLKKYFMGDAGIPQNTVEHKLCLAVAEWLRDNIQYSDALLPFIPKEQRETHEQLKKKIYESEIVKESMGIYQFSVEGDSSRVDMQGYSVNSLITFANIWLDIDKIFMIPELLDYKQYFYENKNILPPEDKLERAEILAVRILSAFCISEHQLKQLPLEYVESYYSYKELICSSELVKRVFEKVPLIKRELSL